MKLLIKILLNMDTDKKSTVKLVLTIVKYVVTALLGALGGSQLI